MKNPAPNARRTRVSLFLIYWLCALVGLLAWKASVYSEAASIRDYLGMTTPAPSLAWWFAASR